MSVEFCDHYARVRAKTEYSESIKEEAVNCAVGSSPAANVEKCWGFAPSTRGRARTIEFSEPIKCVGALAAAAPF